MNIARLSNGAIRKVRSGGGQAFGLPSEWITTSYGSGWPIQPVTMPTDVEMPRTIDFPISVNATLTPRTGYGLMPFAALLEVYENVMEVRIPVNLIWRELSSFIPRIVDSEGSEIPDHPYAWMTKSPDGRNPFSVWMTRFLKSAKIYDAPALFIERGSGGIKALHYIDGSTLFLIIDEYGNSPKPQTLSSYVQSLSEREKTHISLPPRPSFGELIPGTPTTSAQFAQVLLARMAKGEPIPEKVPAYTQIIKGTPYSWWSADDIWYMPQNRRINSPYGESFIEQAWPWIMVIVNIVAFELGHYKTGTMPEGFVTLPSGLFPTLDKINKFEQGFDLRQSADSPVARSRLRMFPDGSKYIPTKKPDFPIALYNTAVDGIFNTIGIPTSELRAPSSGLGGKGFKEGGETELGRKTLDPHRKLIANAFNEMMRRDGVDDAFFDLDYPQEEVDAEKQRETAKDLMINGVITPNDAMAMLSYDPVDDSMSEDGTPDPHHIANKHIFVAGSTIYVLEDMQTEGGAVVPQFQPNQMGGAPMGPDTGLDPHTPEDGKTADMVLQNIRDHGTVGSATTSIPSSATPKNISTSSSTKTPETSENTATSTTETTKPNQTSVTKMVELDESNRLDKHCGVCPEDDDYYRAPISRDIPFSFPGGSHANEVEVVAMMPEGLPYKPALWKPEGGELPELQDRIGGPQFVREEAAYLLDRSLGFMLVPVSYVAEADGETGAAIYYTLGAGEPLDDVAGYGVQWVERAAVFDYISTQQDRGFHHNFLTHPDDTSRPILIDNGLAFPADPSDTFESPFCDAWVEKELSMDVVGAIVRCLGDAATWADIASLIGPMATAKAMANAQKLVNERAIMRDPGATPPTAVMSDEGVALTEGSSEV